MKIEDLVLLLNNRLREYKLSKNYATMSGNLERVNEADKEIIALEDTLFKLNLLVDTSKSVAVKEASLAEVLTDGSVAVLSEYDITPYATDPLHEEKIMQILSKMKIMDTAEKVDDYIKGKYAGSPVTGGMVMSAAGAYAVDVRLMMAIMEQDSRFGTAGLAVRTVNPGNVGNDDGGNTRTYDSWQEGVTAVAEWLNRHRIVKDEKLPIVKEEEGTSTSTPQIIISTDTGTTTIQQATSTPADSTPATSTPETTITINNATTTATTTPDIVVATSTPETIITINNATSTATTTDTTTSGQATSTPEIIVATSTPETTIMINTATTTPEQVTPAPPPPPDSTMSTTTAATEPN